MGEIAKTVGEKWKQLDDDEKQVPARETTRFILYC